MKYRIVEQKLANGKSKFLIEKIGGPYQNWTIDYYVCDTLELAKDYIEWAKSNAIVSQKVVYGESD